MNTEHLSQHLNNLLLTLLLATNILLLFKEGSPSLVKPSQARAEGSGIRKLQQFPRTDRFVELSYFFDFSVQNNTNDNLVVFELLFASMPAVVDHLL